MSSNSSGSSEIFFPLIAVSAATLVASLALLQSDRISRHILNCTKLERKRRGEYKYNWKAAVEKTKLQLDYYLAGGIEAYKEDPECVWKNAEYISKENEMDALIVKMLDKKDHTSRYYALKIDKDPHDPTDDYFLFLAQEVATENGEGSSPSIKVYELPLVKFGMKLADAFEDQLTTTALCFVADASGGKASSMLETLMKESKTGVAVVSEPFWMTQLAGLSEASVLASSKIKKLLFALCRLDAWSVRETMGDCKTVMITLPGQATVTALLPLVQAVFPEDRHLFCFDGCVASVQRGMYAKRQYKRGHLYKQLSSIIHGLCQDPVRYNTPLPSNSPLTKDVSLRTLADALSNLSVKQAQIVEAWMSSVDAYFKLKQEENTNGYLPFVLKMGFLTEPKGNFEPRTDSFWSLTALLQFVMGSHSRALPEGVVDAAKEWLKDYNQLQAQEQTAMNKAVVISENQRKAIENCCFQHKLILIGNKTLQDTVLPREHWTLKQATRAGCSCCGPDPYEQMEEEEEEAEESKTDRSASAGGFDMNSPGAFAMAFKTDNPTLNGGTSKKPETTTRSSAPKTGYVDGKMGFAFDPTRF